MRALELGIDNYDYFCVTYRFKKYNDKIPIMRDKIGNRPIEVKELGGNLILKFYPMVCYAYMIHDQSCEFKIIS